MSGAKGGGPMTNVSSCRVTPSSAATICASSIRTGVSLLKRICSAAMALRLAPALESILTTSPLCRVSRCVRSSGELGHGHGGHRHLAGQTLDVDDLQVDDY